MTDKPIPKSTEAAKEMKRLEDQFDSFETKVNELTLDRMNEAPRLETEPQTKMAQKDISDAKDIYIKPFKSISSKEPFNEKFRSDYEFAKEYVYIIAENNEVNGETIDFWTKPFPGMPAQEWKVPVNKPVWVPRYVAETIKRCSYHRLSMNNNRMTGSDGSGTYYGDFVVDNTVQRLDARPATKKKSIFMGARVF